MKFESNEELKKAIKDNVLDCKGDDLVCDFDIDIEANIINAGNIKAWNITAGDIKARNITAEDINAGDLKARNIKAKDINAWDITAEDISYYAVCFAYKNIECVSIKGRRENCKHFVLDGELKVQDD